MKTTDPVLSREAVAERLAAQSPRTRTIDAEIRAAVAIALCPLPDDVGVLLMQRSDSEHDRWSGHIAFPGGRVDASDASPRHAAERETSEEVGLDLRRADALGRLDDLTGSVESILVSAFVYWVAAPPPFAFNREVQRAVWLPLRELCDPARHERRSFRYAGRDIDAPAIRVFEPGAPVLWGLSYRFLELLLRRLGREIPPMQWHSDL